MRIPACLLALLLIAGLGLSQDGAEGEPKPAKPYTNTRYQVTVTPPKGWQKTKEGPKPAGGWVELVEFTEPRTKATVTLAASATHYRDADEMIAGLKAQFQKSASLAVLGREEQGATAKRSKGILFEYTDQYQGRAQHVVAAYYMHAGNRYRVTGRVREVGWRSVGDDMKSFARSLEFTSRAFSKDKHNYRDEAQNFALSFPEGWTIRVPARGPRVVFNAKRLGIAVWVYVVQPSGETLDENVKARLDRIGDQNKVTKKGRPRMHAGLSEKTVTIDYTRASGGKTWKYRETMVLHRKRFYRFVLAARESAFVGGEPSFKTLIDSLSFIR